ncbi:hypothetical protein Tco_1001980 [Tanacetum coccineum]|uniref:Uncharacterized protein n=1 Tax=Tanacetum coccineum TaxID=301880 RepID=A0ABQ5F793_9ASTR
MNTAGALVKPKWQTWNSLVTYRVLNGSLEDSSSRLSTGDKEPRPQDRSLNKYSTLAAGRIGRQSLGVGNGSLPSICSILL